MFRFVVAVLLLVGCGEEDGETMDGSAATADDIQASCESYCDVIVESPGCDPEAATAKCYELCGYQAAQHEGCADDAIAYFECIIDAPHSCDGTLMWDGVDYPVADDLLACNDEYNRLCNL